MVPFVTSPDDISHVREVLGPHGKSVKIFAKIDQMDGLQNYEKIIHKSDGVVLVRGDIQWEMVPEKLVIAQRWMVEQANLAAKPILIQSQVLESLVSGDKVSRQELSEISIATQEGADSFILSHETSVGINPSGAAVFLSKAIAEAESVFDYEQAFLTTREQLKKQGEQAQNIDLLANTGSALAFEPKENVDMFVCMTESGRIVSFLSKQRPRQPILALSTNGQIVRQMNLKRGVVGYKIPQHLKNKRDELVEHILNVA